RKPRLEMQKRSFRGLAGLAFEIGDSQCELGAAGDYGFIRAQPGPADELRRRPDVAKLAGEPERGADVAPGARAGQAVKDLGNAVDFKVPQCCRRNVFLHRYAFRPPKPEIAASRQDTDNEYRS